MSIVNLGSCKQCDCQLAIIFDTRHPLESAQSKHYRQLVVCGGCGVPHPEHEHSIVGLPEAPTLTPGRPTRKRVPVPESPIEAEIRSLKTRLETLENRRGPGRPRKEVEAPEAVAAEAV